MARAATSSDPFNAIGDVTRRDALDVLARREATVGELAALLACTQVQMSKHLKVLRDVELVRWRQEGRSRVYTVDRTGLAPLQAWLGELTRTVNERYDRLDDHLHELMAADDPTT